MKYYITYIFTLSLTVLSCASSKRYNHDIAIDKDKQINSASIDSTTTVVKDSVKVEDTLIISKDTVIVNALDSIPKINEKFNHNDFNTLLLKHVSETGVVSYSGFIKDKTLFKTYLNSLSDIQPTNDWTKEDKLAYWMNVYNAFTIKLIIDNYPTKSIKDIKDAWDKRFFKLGSKWYNLNDVEHKILRKMDDARIHFGINCASYSCPPLLNKAFTAENVDDELDKLAIRFINDTTRNKISSTHIELSKIFQWFAKDFKTNGSLIDFLNRYSSTPINKNAKKSFLKYNWDLNE